MALSAQAELWAGIRFEDEEHARRERELRELMREHAIDALVVADERLTWRLTGFGAEAPIGSGARPRVCLVGDGHPIRFHVHVSTARCVAEMVAPGIEVVAYEPLEPPIGALAEWLAGIGGGRVGVELTGAGAPRLAPADLRRLQDTAGFEAVDAAPLLGTWRQRKTEAEVERVRGACRITAEAFEAGFRRIRAGMTEREVAAAMVDAMRECGADGGWANCATGRGEYDRIDGVPRTRRIEPGDLVFVDMGANLGGYWADFSRSGVAGGPTAHQERLQAAVHEVTEIGVEALRPGVPLAAVAEAIDGAMAERGLEFTSRAGRYGHGLGLEVTEPPDLAASEARRVEPGMVLTVEPATIDAHGIYHCEEDVLIGDQGPEILSVCDWRLRSLPG